MKQPVTSMPYFFLRIDKSAILCAQAHIADRHSIVMNEISDPCMLYLQPVVKHSDAALQGMQRTPSTV